MRLLEGLNEGFWAALAELTGKGFQLPMTLAFISASGTAAIARLHEKGLDTLASHGDVDGDPEDDATMRLHMPLHMFVVDASGKQTATVTFRDLTSPPTTVLH